MRYLLVLDLAADGVPVAVVTVGAKLFGTGNALIGSWFVSKAPGGSWSAPTRVSTASSDPAATAQKTPPALSALATRWPGDGRTTATVTRRGGTPKAVSKAGTSTLAPSIVP